jgi:hypothetical protein
MTKIYLTVLCTTTLLLLSLFSSAQSIDGYALYNSQNSSTAYLIDAEGDIAHSWSCPSNANYAMALKPNGNIVRGAVNNGNQITGAAVGGMIQELDYDGDIVWEFTYSNANVVSHHDIALMPNGNVLLIAWEIIEEEDLAAIGLDDAEDKKVSHIVEVQQNGTGGEVVWEWHIADHFVQDEDDTLPNYGVVSENPQLLNINIATDGQGGGPGGPGGGGATDWFHVNGIDYNATLDQIVFSSRFLNEIFIIDHSTTTEQAATHEGGNSGMGGDILYRWGKPANYDTAGDQVITGPVHDARWILEGRPNAGFIQVFNNEGGSGNSSVVDAIDAPVNGFNYDKTPNQQYEPASYSWRHECIADANGQSASDRMSNGNVFVNLSQSFMYEADEEGNVVWQYNSGAPKGFRYECGHPGILQMIADGIIDGTQCAVGVSEITKLNATIFPNPSSGVFSVIGEFGANGADEIRVINVFGKEILVLQNAQTINLTAQPSGIYFVTISAGDSQVTRKVIVE